MPHYNFPEHISGNTFLGVQVSLEDQDGPISISGATITLETMDGNILSTGNGGIEITDGAGGVFEVKEQIISWSPKVYDYALTVVFSGGKTRTYMYGTWKVIDRFDII